MSTRPSTFDSDGASPRGLWLTVGALALSALVGVLGLAVGSTGLEPVSAWASDPVAWQSVWDIRAPRSAGAWAAGALLGLAGAVAQGLFRNPLADPFLLGSASGASLGVALALAGLGLTPLALGWWLQLGLTGVAFVGAVLAVLLTLVLARGVQHTSRLLLAGVVVGMVLGALTSLIGLLAPQTLQAMQGFMLGSTAWVGWSSVGIMAGTGAVCVAVAWALARALDGLSLGEATAASLGLRLGPVRVALVAVMALATGTAVAHTGLVAFVGLVAPHLVRAVLRATHATLLPLASLAGGLLLLCADVLARSLWAPNELPVGVLTAVLGGGYLLWLMHRGRS